MLTFAQAKPLLLSAIAQGHLTPFLGAGMSFNACRLWGEFLRQLEEAAKLHGSPLGTPAERAHRAVSLLRACRSPRKFEATLRQALRDEQYGPMTDKTRALATIRWPLALTTNYDDLYYCAANELEAGNRLYHPRVDLVGRRTHDCFRVLASLTEPSSSLLWCLQGFLGGQYDERSDPLHSAGLPGIGPRPDREYLLKEVVVGHSEYRRVTYREPGFRRAFGEVFRKRSLLFIGSSLSEDYFLNLFGEILELQGPTGLPHFAFAEPSKLDARFLAERLNVLVLEGSHGEQTEWLRDLGRSAQEARFVPSVWGVRIVEGTHDLEFQVTDRDLPLPQDTKECLAISVGRRKDNKPRPGRWTRDHMPDLIPTAASLKLPENEYVLRVPGHPVFWAAARRLPTSAGHQGSSHSAPGVETARAEHGRDLRIVRNTACELYDKVAAAGFTHLHLQLSAGPKATFPPLFSLIELARGFGQWARNHPSSHLLVSCHVVDPYVLLNLRSGRINLNEIVCSDLVRFWIERRSSEEDSSRVLVILPETAPLAMAMSLVGVPKSPAWHVEVRPRPFITVKSAPAFLPTEVAADLALSKLGIVPGSVCQLVDTRAVAPQESAPLPR
jgi:hypothetical protein